jgi:seryl-tRNA(Sec) selenium transferase
MAYNPDETAEFVGIERLRGSVDDRAGTLVLRHVGTFADGTAKADLVVISGTDRLHGVTGSGLMVADPGGKVELTITGPA